MSQALQAGLTEQQTAFVHWVARKGLDTDEAARRVGYHPDYGYQLIRKPAIAGAIHEILQIELVAVVAPSAFKVARRLMEDETVSARVRADIAFKFMDRAGHITPSNKAKGAEKALSEMSRDEMLAYIDRNTAEIEKMESELAERAIDISAPVMPRNEGLREAKPMSFLD